MRQLSILAATVLAIASAASGGVLFSDDFNRPDGQVGNGWSNWGD